MKTRALPRRSRLALWSRRAGLLAILVLLTAVVGHRAVGVEAQPTLGLVAVGLALAVWAVLGAVFAFAGIWRDGRKGFGAAILGLAIGLAVLAYPAVLFVGLFTLPALADVTTDVVDPPSFSVIEQQRLPPTPLQYEAQQRAYPKVTSRVYAADPELVFGELQLVVEERDWDVLRSEPPIVIPAPAAELPIAGEVDIIVPGNPAVVLGADIVPEPLPVAVGPPEPDDPAIELAPTPQEAPGYIEAVARTFVVGFREDVVIRVSVAEAGTVVDIRSASRIFEHDFGSNAARILAVLDDLDARLPGALAD